jgi:uncharacterized protein YuzE
MESWKGKPRKIHHREHPPPPRLRRSRAENAEIIQADALYLRLDDSKIIESEEVAPGVILDYNEKDEVVGVEMLYLSKRTPKLKATALEFESV